MVLLTALVILSVSNSTLRFIDWGTCGTVGASRPFD